MATAQNAVLYLRMSSSRQETSIADQRSALVDYAAQKGYRVAGEYVDEAVSGDDTAKRVGFLRMRDDAASGAFSVVLAWDQDRFGRFDPIEGGYWILPFRDAGVRLETIAQGRIDWNDFASRLLFVVQQEAKHGFLRDLSRNTIRGRLARAKEGKGLHSEAPFGYSVADGKLVINPTAAEVVRRVFRDYLAPGASLRSVANQLNESGISAPRGGTWQPATIRAILTNEKHAGSFVFGRVVSGKYHGVLDGEIVARTKTEPQRVSKPIVHRDAHDPIVDRRTFDEAQEKLRLRKRDTAHLRDDRGYLFTGLLRCGDCGRPMVGNKAKRRSGPVRNYVCGGYLFRGKATCSCNRAWEDEIVHQVVDLIENNLLSASNRRRIQSAIRDRVAGRRLDDHAASVKDKRRRLGTLSRMIEQGADRLLEVPESLVPQVAQRLKAAETERQQLLADLESSEVPVHKLQDRDQQETRAALAALECFRETVQTADRGVLREMLQRLLDRIEVRFETRHRGSLPISRACGGTVFLRPDPRLSGLVTVTSCR